MAKKKSRLNVSLDDLEREKLEKLAEEAGLSLSRTIAQLIRKAKTVNKMTGRQGDKGDKKELGDKGDKEELGDKGDKGDKEELGDS